MLLKNEDDILPLKEWQKIAIVGDMAGNMRYQAPAQAILIRQNWFSLPMF
ncbi:glycoside hydrolase family 3 C-terminal domain-containing protein [Thermoclostridium stercorarium]|nr:glycoside hydrolase family 3 C-terminal domain-containing protein [Thermoclostridium stercorarium]